MQTWDTWNFCENEVVTGDEESEEEEEEVSWNDLTMIIMNTKNLRGS